jgi:hypothetical protein
VTRATSIRLVDGLNEIVLASPVVDSTRAFATKSHEFASSAVRALSQVRSGRSGVADNSSLHDASSFKADLYIFGDSTQTRYNYLNQLQAMLAPHKRPYVYMQRDGWLTERRAQLRGDTLTCVVGKNSLNYLEVSFQAEMPDGVLEEANATSVLIRPETATAGLSYPTSYPLSYTPSNSLNTYYVTAYGTTVSIPMFRIYGECNDPSFRVEYEDGATGIISLTNLQVGSGHYLDIDVGNRAVYLDSTVESSYYAKVDWSVSSWWEIKPGLNRITFNADNADAGCFAQVVFRQTWLP